MRRLAILLSALALLTVVTVPGLAQDAAQASPAQSETQNTQPLPSAPTPMQPRFPGAKLPAAAQTQASPTQAPALTSLPPAHPQEEARPAASPSTAGAAQQAAPEQTQSEDSGEFHIGVEVNLVNLIFTASDKHGHFIKDLKQDDIHLLDEGKPPERIVAFESETGLPLRVGLLIDASNSIRDRFRFEQDAAIEFLHEVVRPKSDKAFVIGFDSLSDLTQDFTDNAELLSRGVGVLRPGGGTALHDAVFTACEKLGKAEVGGAARRAIILLSDGDDNQSRHSREEAIEAALRAEVLIYVISTDVTESNSKGDKVLMRYAEATGGRVFYPLRIEEVSSAFSEIQDELRSQYVLAYKPQDFVTNGSYRSISIDVPKRGNVKVRVRKGYYAPK